MSRKLIGIAALALHMAMATGSAQADDVVVRVMTTETDPKTQKVFGEIIAEFEKERPGVRVKAEFAGWSDINKKLLASIAAGDPPEIITVHDFYIFDLVDKGVIRPVDGVIDAIGRDDFVPVAIDGYTRDGHIWGVPFSLGQTVLWYRKDLYEKYGLKEPKTWADYEENLKVLNKAGSAGEGASKFYGTAFPAGINSHTEETVHSWLWNNGATITDEQGNSKLSSPAAVETFAFLKRIAAYAPPGHTSYGHQEALNSFATGAVAHTEYGYRLLNNLERLNPALLETAVPIPYPLGPNEKARSATHVIIKGWAILKNAKHQKAAEAFLKFLESGDRKIRMMHTVPIHYWPPRKSIAQDPRFLDNKLMKTPAGQRALALAPQGFERGALALRVGGTVLPKIGSLMERRLLSNTLQKVLIKKMSPEDATKEASDIIK
ncbi:MAG: ABC transporter substrate-binding protein [Variibacter sp.]